VIREVKKDVSLSNNKSKKGIIKATPTASRIEDINKKKTSIKNNILFLRLKKLYKFKKLLKMYIIN
jgi:hypothetical protein